MDNSIFMNMVYVIVHYFHYTFEFKYTQIYKKASYFQRMYVCSVVSSNNENKSKFRRTFLETEEPPRRNRHHI